MQPGDVEHGLVRSVALELAVPQDLPVFQSRRGVFHARSCPAMEGVLCLLRWAEVALASSSAVRDEEAGALVAVVGEGRGAAAGPIDAGLGERAASNGASYLITRFGNCQSQKRPSSEHVLRPRSTHVQHEGREDESAASR